MTAIRPQVAWCLAALVALSCSLGSNENGNRNEPPPATGGSPPASGITLSFKDPPNALRPGQELPITVKVTPPGAYVVRFALLADVSGRGTELDAALDRSEVQSDRDGQATVTLTAPNALTRFSLRAQVEDVSQTLELTVTAGALVTLNVHPIYDGRRQISEWIASAHPDQRCEAFEAGLFTDASWLIKAAPDAPLQLQDIPFSTTFAVTVRSGEFASGCADLAEALPNAVTPVDVNISDLPIDLADTTLSIVLGLDPKDPAFSNELDAVESEISEALLASAENDVSMVLDGMQSSLKVSSQPAFVRAREEGNWDQRLLTALGRGADTRVRSTALRWSSVGRAALLGADAFEITLAPANMSGTVPELVVERVAGLPPEDWMSAEDSSWSVDAIDTLAFSGTFSWLSSKLLTNLAITPAAAETGESDLVSALSETFSCSRLASELSLDTTEAATAFQTACASECLQDLCVGALQKAWDRAAAVSEKDPSSLELRAAGPATVGTHAQLVAVQGTWVGRLVHGARISKTGGAFKGFSPRTSPTAR